MVQFFYDADSEMNLYKAQELGLDSDDVGYIKMPYTICGESKGCELITPELSKDFFQKVNAGNMPTTSALNAQEYIDIFEPAFQKGDEIFYVSFGSRMSGTFENLALALRELRAKYPDVKFTRYDTKAISMGTGLAVVAAYKYIKAGKSVEETVAMLDELVDNINISIVADDLQYLKRGGRLTAVKALLGTMLQLKPIIKLTTEGTLNPFTSVPGRNKALLTVTNEIIANAKYLDKYPIVLMNATCPQDAERVAARIKAARPEAEIWQFDVGPVIGTHCGPGTLGFCYVGNHRPDSIKE